MKLVDTSVILAWLLAEEASPPSAFFDQHLLGSKLLRVETAVRLRRLGRAELISDADVILWSTPGPSTPST
jgi:hypothetical protein